MDVVILRDVIERHSVSNPVALRWMQRHLLANPAAPFSVQKFYDALRSQGIAVGKDTLHAYLGYLEDAFLIRTVSLYTASERQRMVNPRKGYPVDPGPIPIFERTGRPNLGHALETAVLIELERCGFEVSYVRAKEGFEVDFLAAAPGQPPELIQVCLDISESTTREREVRALAHAAAQFPKAKPVLQILDSLGRVRLCRLRLSGVRLLRGFLTGESVAAMGTIPGWYIERKSPNGIPVLNPKQVRSYLDGKKETVLSEKMIKSICHQVEQKCRDVDLWEWY